MSDETCSICIENIKMKYKLECGHSFCYLCLKFSLLGRASTCPLCRSDVPRDILENATYDEQTINTQSEISIDEEQTIINTLLYDNDNDNNDNNDNDDNNNEENKE